MNRNTESRFALNPTRLDMERSVFDRSASVKTSFNTGDIIPFYVDEVLPGDTFNIRTSRVVRLQTLITPMMDNLYLDTYYFFVPNRLVWEHWKEFNGENSSSPWIPTVDYSVPQITAPDGGWKVGTIADYFGLPINVDNISVSALPFRAYALIMNEWFRDENLTQPLNIPTTDSNSVGSNGSDFVTDVVLGGKPFKASKYHDYFTSALPSPQKGPDVTLGLLGDIPVRPMTSVDLASNEVSLHFKKLNGEEFNGLQNVVTNAGDTMAFGTTSGQGAGAIFPSNLGASLSGISVASVNQLRLAFQVQRLYEKDARGGTRYIEVLKSHFGVTSPDARLQRPEYLGGNRVPINVNQVVQQSSTDSTSPQGNVAGYSVTTDTHNDFTRSFTEHGFIIGLCVARYDHSYQQGIERFWSRKDRFDYYWPVLANIGEQPILNKEIYASGTDTDNEVFGYQEAWADYRYRPNRITGEMRSTAELSLDVWHLGDDYVDLPRLSDGWIREDASNVDRVLAVNSSVANQLFADFYIENKTTRPMPVYSIPGLIDHH